MLFLGDTVENQEAQGQAQLLRSAVLPTKGLNRHEFEALGFIIGKPVPGDEMFTECTLPEGWKKERGDHSMWSYVVDQLGRRRVACFYKAAFYDRKAFCRLETPYGHVSNALYHYTPFVFDDTWLTRKVVLQVLEQLVNDLNERITKYQQFADDAVEGADSVCTYWQNEVSKAEEERDYAVVRIKELEA